MVKGANVKEFRSGRILLLLWPAVEHVEDAVKVLGRIIFYLDLPPLLTMRYLYPCTEKLLQLVFKVRDILVFLYLYLLFAVMVER